MSALESRDSSFLGNSAPVALCHRAESGRSSLPKSTFGGGVRALGAKWPRQSIEFFLSEVASRIFSLNAFTRKAQQVARANDR